MSIDILNNDKKQRLQEAWDLVQEYNSDSGMGGMLATLLIGHMDPQRGLEREEKRHMLYSTIDQLPIFGEIGLGVENMTLGGTMIGNGVKQSEEKISFIVQDPDILKQFLESLETSSGLMNDTNKDFLVYLTTMMTQNIERYYNINNKDEVDLLLRFVQCAGVLEKCLQTYALTDRANHFTTFLHHVRQGSLNEYLLLSKIGLTPEKIICWYLPSTIGRDCPPDTFLEYWQNKGIPVLKKVKKSEQGKVLMNSILDITMPILKQMVEDLEHNTNVPEYITQEGRNRYKTALKEVLEILQDLEQ